jgi:hypothetical protein
LCPAEHRQPKDPAVRQRAQRPHLKRGPLGSKREYLMGTLPLRFLILTILVATLACAAPNGPSDALSVTVVSAERNSSRIVRFDLRLTNSGSVPLYVPGCGGVVSAWLQVKRAGAWGTFGGGLCHGDVSQGALPIAPGESVGASVGVGGADAGEYRAVISVADNPAGAWDLVASASARIL